MTGLKLRSLTLSHFRSHKHLTIEADDRPIAIYGSNGAGKTNILEAISLLSPGRGLRRAKIDEMARQPENMGWKISGVLNRLGQMHELETSYKGEGSRSVSIDEKNTSQIALGKLGRIVWLVPVMDRLWVEGAEGRRRFLDRLTMSLEPNHAEHSLAYEKAMRERNRMLKDGIRDPAWYDAIEDQMATTAAIIETNRLATIDNLQLAQQEVQSSFPSANLTLVGTGNSSILTKYDDLSTAFKESRHHDMNAGRTLVGPHRDDLLAIYTAKGIEAKQCSTGEQKALLVSLILANGRAVAKDFGAPPIYLLDEVSAHLDMDRRAALYDEICALGAQAWMTGTEIKLFDSMGKRASYIEITEDNGISTVHPH